jgi:ribosomal protein L7Ae-like RNA K-turn-binding protein
VTAAARPFVVFGFPSVHDTLQAEEALKAAGIPAVTIPSPKELGELCGIALRVTPDDAPAAESALALACASARARADITDL